MSLDEINPIKRLSLAFVGLLAGDAVLLVCLLEEAARLRARLVVEHAGGTFRLMPGALEHSVLYGIFSFWGWLLVGVPIAVFVPPAAIRRLSWPLTLFVGAALGPVTLLLIFLLHGHGHVQLLPDPFYTRIVWGFSVVVSTVSFAVYASLLRWMRLFHRRARPAA